MKSCFLVCIFRVELDKLTRESGAMSATRVVFLHGLESGPGGRKARWLEERYAVTCEPMHVRLFERNGFQSCSLVVLTVGVGWERI